MGMPEFPQHRRFESQYEPSFASDRATLNLSGAPFDFFFKEIERFLADYPTIASTCVMPHERIWALRTKKGFADLPPLFVYYRLEERPNRIIFLGLSHDWSNSDDIGPAESDAP
jgi:hypothetical protein